MQAPSLDWNVVVTVYDGEFAETIRLLTPFGDLAPTDYWNVLAMVVPDIPTFLADIENAIQRDASIPNAVSRIIPVTHKFRFQSPDEFEKEACLVVDEWVPEVSGKSFHVRMHRRGFKGRLSSQRAEQLLDHHILQRLELEGAGARIDFEDPDLIIAVETIGQTAGLSRWTRAQRQAFELVRLD
jgi:tRNA(Ser,Leu) C12 N-acetylase TAN1